VAIKKLFYDRRYEQRELTTLDEIKKSKLCRNIIELKDRYFQNVEEIDPNSKPPGKLVHKEYLYIVTDYLPFTICDLKVNTGVNNSNFYVNSTCMPLNYNLEAIKQVMSGLF